MRKALLGSVAALALITSASLSAAQNSGTGMQGPAGGAMKSGEAPAAQSRSDGGSMSAQPSAKGAASETTAAPATKTDAAATERGESKGAKRADDMNKESAPKASGDMKADSTAKPAAGATASPTAASKDAKNPNSDSKPATADSKPAGADSKTTGNAATSATAAPPAEKRSQITTAIRQEKVEEVTNVNFNISVGTAVPASVRYHPLPTRIVEIYPEWRGYDFIVVRGRYIILRPQTHEIVYIIES